MILDGFRKVNIRKRIKKELLRSDSLKARGNQKIDTILILVDENSQENLDQIISKKLNIDVSKATTIFFKTNQDISNYECELIDKGFSLFGKIKNEKIVKLVLSEFDLLLNYTNDNLYLNYVTVFSKAKFKVGLKANQQEIFDLIIDVDKNNVDLFHSELIKYLKILNKT
ncbi:MAG: hypothetical protein QM478_03865 [Flavobacteriaceae bacterium]